MGDSVKEILSVVVAYLVLYVALWGFQSWLQKRIYKQYSKHYNFNNNSSNGMSVDKACEILGISKAEYRKMSKNDLKKAYWKKAKEVHPYKPNGSEEGFKNVKNAYDFVYAQAA